MPINFLTFKPFQGSKEHVFIDPDTQHQYKANSRKELVQMIVSYRSQNKLSKLDLLDAVLDNYQCKLPMNSGMCETNNKLQRGVLAYIKGGLALLKQMAFKKFVTQEIADARAEICIKCPYNIFPDKGNFVKWTDEIALHSIGEKRSKYHDELGSCEICSCILKAKVFYSGELDLTKEEVEKLPHFCWQKKEINGKERKSA